MTELAKLLAIKLLVKDLKYSDTTLTPILDKVEYLIETERANCTKEYSDSLSNLNNLIEENF